MAPMESKGLLGRLFSFRDKDPLWEGFVNRPLSDPNNDLSAAIRSAPEGAVYPVKTEVPEPRGMTANMKELGVWLGVDMVGIARLQAWQVRAEELRDGQGERSAEDIVQDYPYVIVCGVETEHDPNSTVGMAGRVATLEGNLVSFNLGGLHTGVGVSSELRRGRPGEGGGGCGTGPAGSGRAFRCAGQEGLDTFERSHPDGVAHGAYGRLEGRHDIPVFNIRHHRAVRRGEGCDLSWRCVLSIAFTAPMMTTSIL